GQNVRHDEHMFVGQNVIGRCGGGTVRTFDQDTGLYLVGIFGSNDVFRGRGDQDFAIGDQQLFRGAPLGAFEAVYGAFLLTVVPEGLNVDALAVVQAAIPFANANYFVADLVHEQGRVGADVAESLDDDAGTLASHLEVLDGFIAYDHDTPAGSLPAATRAAHVHRLARNHRGDRLPHVHGIGVHHPRHGLLIG